MYSFCMNKNIRLKSRIDKIFVLYDIINPSDIANGCFENDVAIEGNDIQLANSSLSINDVKECQRHCQSNSECNYFVFDYGKNECLVKRSDITKTFKKYSLLGPKYCGKLKYMIYKW